MRNLISQWDVYLVTDRHHSKGRSLKEIVTSAARGGVSAVQLREKELETKDFYEQGLEIREFLRTRGVAFIVNDRIDIALALDADGVHIGPKDLPVSVARRILGPDRIIGLSIESPAEIDEDAVKYSDYLAVSPVFATSTKAKTAAPWGLEGVTLARSMTDLPLLGIGSIAPANAREVARAGIDCVAVVTAIVSADDPCEATRRLVEEVRAGKALRS